MGIIGHDHETALAGGFDIVAAGYWVRPDNAAIVRFPPPMVYRIGRYSARRANDEHAFFFTMREAVEWIGPTDSGIDIEWHESREG